MTRRLFLTALLIVGITAIKAAKPETPGMGSERSAEVSRPVRVMTMNVYQSPADGPVTPATHVDLNYVQILLESTPGF